MSPYYGREHYWYYRMYRRIAFMTVLSSCYIPSINSSIIVHRPYVLHYYYILKHKTNHIFHTNMYINDRNRYMILTQIEKSFFLPQCSNILRLCSSARERTRMSFEPPWNGGFSRDNGSFYEKSQQKKELFLQKFMVLSFRF